MKGQFIACLGTNPRVTRPNLADDRVPAVEFRFNVLAADSGKSSINLGFKLRLWVVVFYRGSVIDVYRNRDPEVRKDSHFGM